MLENQGTLNETMDVVTAEIEQKNNDEQDTQNTDNNLLVQNITKTQEVANDTLEKKKNALSIKLIICIVFFVFSITCFVLAISRVANSSYKYYRESYQTIIEGYENAVDLKNDYNYYSAYSTGYSKDTLDVLVIAWESKMSNCEARIKLYRTEACFAGFAGLTFGAIGAWTLLENKRKEVKNKEAIITED